VLQIAACGYTALTEMKPNNLQTNNLQTLANQLMNAIS